MTAEPETAAAPVKASLMACAMKVAVLRVRADEAEAAYQAARSAAVAPFAAAREDGITQVEPALPDGTKVGLVSIKRGPAVVTVDEDELLSVAACNDPADVEDYVTDKALRDPRVVALLSQHLPELVRSRVRPARRAQYQKEWGENAGKVTSRLAGERVQVATIRHLPAAGDFGYRAAEKAPVLLAEAIAAGLISEWGEYLAGQPAEPLPEPEAAAAEVAADGGCPLLGDLGPGTVARCLLGAGHEPPCSWEDDVAEARAEAAGTPDLAGELRRALTAAGAVTLTAPAEPDHARAALDKAMSRGGPRHARGPQHPPTGEQQQVVDAWTGTGDNLTIRAGAGAGKTSTLVMLGDARPDEPGLYLAYNRAIAAEAKRRFPPNISCSTAHALAMRAVGRPYAHRLNGPRLRAREVALILGINEPLEVDGKVLSPEQVGRLVMETADRFMRSADREVAAHHVPRKPGLDSDATMSVLRSACLPAARKAWADLASLDGKLKFSHDAYLKIFQLSDPDLGVPCVLLDEAQDADPVVSAILLTQKNARLITVGDPNQEIYQWRGSCNAMDAFGGIPLTLSQSFRFGQAVADEGNKWLSILGSDLRITGNPAKASALGVAEWPDAVLCRTNGGVLSEAMRAVEAGKKAGIVGGGADIRRLAEAAAALKAGRPTAHPELFAFSTWAEVQDHVENDPSGADLKVMVQLIDDHGPDEIIRIVDSLTDEASAEVVVSTAHKAKGLEWDSVRISGDFRAPKATEPGGEPEIPPADARLAYVAVTRAKKLLDREGLAWVDRFLPLASVAGSAGQS